MRQLAKRFLAEFRCFGCFILGLSLLPAGCSTSNDQTSGDRRITPPAIPSFLSGPVGLLLTNVDGFSAHLVMEDTTVSNTTAIVTGQVLGRGTKLLFAPDSRGSKRKGRQADGFVYIWDVTTKSGFILSEALQGYAPSASSERFAFVTVSLGASSPPPGGNGGNGSSAQEVDVASGDGSVTAFWVWRAPGSNMFPQRIVPAKGPSSFSITLSNFQPVAPAAALFEPPDGFTKYESADAMMTELLARGQAGKKSGATFSDPEDRGGRNRGGRYQGSQY
jgi:hypothetical protein